MELLGGSGGPVAMCPQNIRRLSRVLANVLLLSALPVSHKTSHQEGEVGLLCGHESPWL